MTVEGKPLNGERTHLLKPASIAVLRSLKAYGPLPRPEVNPGSRDRLSREGLVREVMLPSPYAMSLGKPYPHVEITEAGLARLCEIDEASRPPASISPEATAFAEWISKYAKEHPGVAVLACIGEPDKNVVALITENAKGKFAEGAAHALTCQPDILRSMIDAVTEQLAGRKVHTAEFAIPKGDK